MKNEKEEVKKIREELINTKEELKKIIKEIEQNEKILKGLFKQIEVLKKENALFKQLEDYRNFN